MGELTRRATLRGLSLSAMAVGTAALAGCGSRADSRAASSPSGSTTAPPPTTTPPTPDPTSPPPTIDGGDLQLVSSEVERAVGDPAAIPDVVTGMHQLGAGLYGRLAGAPGNLALSPFSVAVALGLAVNGAKGRTASEMLDVLGADDVGRLDRGVNALTAHVDGLSRRVPGSGLPGEEPQRIELASANALFGQRGVTWDPGFLDVLAADFGAGVQVVDWEGATEAARKAVNAWTAERTRDRIDEILPSGSVDEDTRLVLVNALYLKAPWDRPFEEGLTRPRPFDLADGSTVDVPTMTTESYLPYAEGAGYVAASLPFAGDTLRLTLLLPDAGRLADLERAVTDGDLPEMLDLADLEDLSLRVPRWTFRTEVSLAEQLATLGMPKAFDGYSEDPADFTGMTTDIPLHIAEVLHQVFVDVNENGAEAAAATAIIVAEPVSAGGPPPPPPIEVYLDRPFLFVLHDTVHRTPLFVGRVADPRS